MSKRYVVWGSDKTYGSKISASLAAGIMAAKDRFKQCGTGNKNAAQLERRYNLLAAHDVRCEPVYLYRRLGLNDFVTCDLTRYTELSAKPGLFETKILYDTPQRR